MNLVAFVGTDKENFGQVVALVNRLECEKIFLVMNKSTPKPSLNLKKIKFIIIDSSKPLLELKKEIRFKLKPELVKEFEVSLSIASGNGKEHMALVSALLSVPVGIKMVAYTRQGIISLT